MLERLLHQHHSVKKYFVRRIQNDDDMARLYDMFSESLTIGSSNGSNHSIDSLDEDEEMNEQSNALPVAQNQKTPVVRYEHKNDE